MRKIKKISSPTKQKVLALLAAGAAFALTQSPTRQMYIIKSLGREFKNIDRQYLYRIIKEFYHHRLIDYKESKDGTVKIKLTNQGKQRTLEYQLDNIQLKKQSHWKGTWWVVMFDIPETKKSARDALRRKLNELGFYELQRSVLIYPYDCQDEIDFIIEVFDLRSYVRIAELTHLTNNTPLKLHFNLV